MRERESLMLFSINYLLSCSLLSITDISEIPYESENVFSSIVLMTMINTLHCLKTFTSSKDIHAYFAFPAFIQFTSLKLIKSIL